MDEKNLKDHVATSPSERFQRALDELSHGQSAKSQHSLKNIVAAEMPAILRALAQRRQFETIASALEVGYGRPINAGSLRTYVSRLRARRAAPLAPARLQDGRSKSMLPSQHSPTSISPITEKGDAPGLHLGGVEKIKKDQDDL